MRSGAVLGATLLALALSAADASAQQQRPRPGGGAAARGQAPAAPQAANLQLVYAREVFTYRGGERRDPFVPLTGENEMGPRFETLQLTGIIFSTSPIRPSVASFADADGRVYRARVGDVVGNSTIVEIGPSRVVLAVENFGTIRQEMLELQRNQGANR